MTAIWLFNLAITTSPLTTVMMIFARAFILAIIAGACVGTESSHHHHHSKHHGKHQLLRKGHFMHVLKEKGLLLSNNNEEQPLPSPIHIDPVQIDFSKIGQSLQRRIRQDENTLRGSLAGLNGWEDAAKEDLNRLAGEGDKGYLADLSTMPRQAKQAHEEMMRTLEGPESNDAIRAAAQGV